MCPAGGQFELETKGHASFSYGSAEGVASLNAPERPGLPTWSSVPRGDTEAAVRAMPPHISSHQSLSWPESTATKQPWVIHVAS